MLYRNDAEHDFRPFGPHAVRFNEMMAAMPQAGRKPAMRFYGTIFHPSSIEAMMTDYGNGTYTVAWNARVGNAPSMTIAQSMQWAYKTGDSPDIRAVPYLTCIEEYTEDEWMALVEFLGVPYNPSVDTPQAKPYAYLRYLHRNGNGTPWTDEFREIVIELGNETWHQGAGDYGWHGWGRPNHVHHGGLEYGLFARYMFDEHVRQMPAWRQYQLGDKIKFALRANYDADEDAYAELAARQGPDISYIGHANYVGPKWETCDTGTSTFDDHGVQMTLLGMHTRMKDLIAQAAVTRDHLNATAGIRYELTAYEGGPSGYWANRNAPEIDELYGISAAMGLAALDAWLFSSRHGYRYQCYLGFSSGRWWSSHTLPESGGFRAHPGWLALKLRNRYAVGTRMLATRHADEPTISSDGQDIALISSYAMTDGQTYSVFVLSRKLDGNHDGLDFGGGHTPVTLHLPFDEVRRITRYRLERSDGRPADPRINNRDALNVVIGSQQIPVSEFSAAYAVGANTGGEAGGIAPGSINLFVFETGSPDGPADGGPGNSDTNGDNAADPGSTGGGGCFLRTAVSSLP